MSLRGASFGDEAIPHAEQEIASQRPAEGPHSGRSEAEMARHAVSPLKAGRRARRAKTLAMTVARL